MDNLAALRLQIEWGADEALLDTPVNRLAPKAAARPLAPAAARPGPSPEASTMARAAPEIAQVAGDLASLHTALDGFEECLLRATASHTVAPSGNPASGLVLIAEAPGPDDDRSGEAFSGAAGDKLDQLLRSAGLTRDDRLVTMLIPWRPPGGRPAYDAEITQCLPFLHRLLALVRPHHIVLLGTVPLRALAGSEATLRKHRGRWSPLDVPGLPTPVPALAMPAFDAWLAGPTQKQAVWADLLNIAQALTERT